MKRMIIGSRGCILINFIHAKCNVIFFYLKTSLAGLFTEKCLRKVSRIGIWNNPD